MRDARADFGGAHRASSRIAAAALMALPLGGCAESLFYYPVREPTPVASWDSSRGREIAFSSRDGTRLHGWFVPAVTGERAPSLLYLHGNYGNLTYIHGAALRLPDSGYNVFAFDYRGFGESEGSPMTRGPLIADAEAALDTMLAQPEVDPERVGLYGRSLGGAIGLLVMADRAEVRAAVLECPFSSWRLAAATYLGGPAPDPFTSFLSCVLISDECRPVDAISAIERPILIFHGDADTTVPIVHGWILRDASHGHAQLVECPGEDHFPSPWSRAECREALLHFLATNLGDGVVVPSPDPESLAPQASGDAAVIPSAHAAP